MKQDARNSIDFVVLWVDGSDERWLQEKSIYEKNPSSLKSAGDVRDERYREWGLLKYWFRSVETFAPWVRKVFFVTWGHTPTWLNLDHPKLRLVKHSDFIPDKYLPTFNSNSIELNLHRIPDLSEKFVLFNDDMFLLKETEPSLFFKGELPCSTAMHVPDRVDLEKPFYIPLNNAALINRHFDMRKVVLRNFGKWFTPLYGINMMSTLLMLPYGSFYGFYRTHLPLSHRKTVFSEVWESEGGILDETCSHRFRESSDISHWAMDHWQIAEGKFVPRRPSVGKVFLPGVDYEPCNPTPVVEYVKGQKGHMVCVNDGDMSAQEVYVVQKMMREAFDFILPNRSSFELDEDEVDED